MTDNADLSWQPHEAEDAAGPGPRMRPSEDAAGPGPRMRPSEDRGKWLLGLVKGPEAEVESEDKKTAKDDWSDGAGDFVEYLYLKSGELQLDIKRWQLTDAQLKKGLSSLLVNAIRKKIGNSPQGFLNVDFSENKLTQEGMSILVDFLLRLNENEAGPKIFVRTLRIYRNHLGDDGALQVARLLVCQPSPMHELHLSHNHISNTGAAMILLAFNLHPLGIYPFRLPTRASHFGACWVRLEQNDVTQPAALLKVLDDQYKLYVVETSSRSTGPWGPGRSPAWATRAHDAPKAVLHVFQYQVGSKGSHPISGKLTKAALHQAEAFVEAADEATQALLKSEQVAVMKMKQLSDGQVPVQEKALQRPVQSPRPSSPPSNVLPTEAAVASTSASATDPVTSTTVVTPAPAVSTPAVKVDTAPVLRILAPKVAPKPPSETTGIEKEPQASTSRVPAEEEKLATDEVVTRGPQPEVSLELPSIKQPDPGITKPEFNPSESQHTALQSAEKVQIPMQAQTNTSESPKSLLSTVASFPPPPRPTYPSDLRGDVPLPPSAPPVVVVPASLPPPPPPPSRRAYALFRQQQQQQQESDQSQPEELHLLKAQEILATVDCCGDLEVLDRWNQHLRSSSDPVLEAKRIMTMMSLLVKQGFCVSRTETSLPDLSAQAAHQPRRRGGIPIFALAPASSSSGPAPVEKLVQDPPAVDMLSLLQQLKAEEGVQPLDMPVIEERINSPDLSSRLRQQLSLMQADLGPVDSQANSVTDPPVLDEDSLIAAILRRQVAEPSASGFIYQ